MKTRMTIGLILIALATIVAAGISWRLLDGFLNAGTEREKGARFFLFVMFVVPVILAIKGAQLIKRR